MTSATAENVYQPFTLTPEAGVELGDIQPFDFISLGLGELAVQDVPPALSEIEVTTTESMPLAVDKDGVVERRAASF